MLLSKLLIKGVLIVGLIHLALLSLCIQVRNSPSSLQRPRVVLLALLLHTCRAQMVLISMLKSDVDIYSSKKK